MGREVCRSVAAQSDLELVAAVDTLHAGTELAGLLGQDVGALVVAGELSELKAAGAQVVVDFTRIDVARATLAYCAAEGMHAVVGTTGFTEDDLIELRRRFGGSGEGSSNCLLASNFAIGAVLMERFAELAAPWFDGAEIVELHHQRKLDAPSGTAMHTAERMTAAALGVRVGGVPARSDGHLRSGRGPGRGRAGRGAHPLGPPPGPGGPPGGDLRGRGTEPDHPPRLL